MLRRRVLQQVQVQVQVQSVQASSTSLRAWGREWTVQQEQVEQQVHQHQHQIQQRRSQHPWTRRFPTSILHSNTLSSNNLSIIGSLRTMSSSPTSKSSSSSSLRIDCIGSVDQGTSSTRFILFDKQGNVIDTHQVEINQIYTDGETGWTEHDPMELYNSVLTCINAVMARNPHANVLALGITNQRETTVVWDRRTGNPLHNAIVWHDGRTASVCNELVSKFGTADHFRSSCGLPISTYFSAIKLHWILHVAPTLPPAKRRSLSPTLAQSLQDETAMFGTVDSWLIWNMTGGAQGRGAHVTDVTNASRTMLMDLRTRQWSASTCEALRIPMFMLPSIRSSAEVYGRMADGVLRDVPIAGCLGDQQAAMVGQLCFEPGSAKNTYGTGCFMLMNTGTKVVESKHGLLTTACYQLGPNKPCVYALEGSVAVAGAAVRWLRDEMKMIKEMKEINDLATQTPDSGGVYFVPAFSGLLSPYWRSDARGVMVGITHSTTNRHFCRAVLDASAYQTYDILQAMVQDSSIPIVSLRVDGGLAQSDPLLQFQADLLAIDVVRPRNLECTAAGAAYAAGLAVRFWHDLVTLREDVSHGGGRVYEPRMSERRRRRFVAGWKKAVTRSFGWIDEATTASSDDEGSEDNSESERGREPRGAGKL